MSEEFCFWGSYVITGLERFLNFFGGCVGFIKIWDGGEVCFI